MKSNRKEYLGGIIEGYDLPDMGKAIRCLIDFAIEMEDQELAIFKLERLHSSSWGETSNQERFAKNKKMGVGR